MSIFKSFATVGGFTMASRVLGFVRDILIANVLGTGKVAEAFFVAFRFPNLFRRLFAEGAFNSAFIPLFSKKLEGEGAAEAKKFAEEAMAVLIFALIILTALAELFMPWLMHGLARGFVSDPEKFDLAVLLTRITFPYLLFVSLLALFSGVLNGFHKFAAAAAAPVVLNIVFIGTLVACIGLGLGNTPQAGVIIAWAVSVAGFLQLLVVWFAAKQIGMALKLRLPRLTPGTRSLIRLGIPGAIAGGITQINIVIGTIIASMQDHAMSWLYYADRLYQLPLGVIGIAIGVVLLPNIARSLRAGDFMGAMKSQNRSLEFSMLLTMPAAVALIAIPEPILQTLFQRGAFTAVDTVAVSRALYAFAWGLPAFVLIKVFSPGYFARENTKTPMYYAGISMMVNVVVSLMLFPHFGHVGIAWGTTIAGWVNALMLWFTLASHRHFVLDWDAKKSLPGIFFASVIMGIGLHYAKTPLLPWFDLGSPITGKIAALFILVIGGMLLYALAAIVTGAVNIAKIKGALRGRS